MIPARYVTIDGYPVNVGDLQTSSRANLGYDQFRARASHAELSRLPWTTTLGSIVTVHDATDQVIWEGRLASPPRVEADQTIRLTAQGHAYQGAKSSRRLPVKVTSVRGWTVGNTSPLDMTQTASAQPTIDYSTSSGHLVDNQTVLTYTTALSVSQAYYAPGAEIRRLTWSNFTVSGTPTVKFYGAHGPNIGTATNRTLLKSVDKTALAAGSPRVDFPANDYDTVIIELAYSAGTSGTMTIANPIIWGYPMLFEAIQSDDIATAIGSIMDWDISLIPENGAIDFPSFDWAADAASGMTEATIPDDFRWLLLEDRGKGPVIDWGPWSQTWEVSGATGATWTLDPLEKYTKVVVQYLNDLGKASAVTATVDDPELFRVSNELQTVAGGLQSVDNPGTLPEQMAANVLAFATAERWRGTINASQVVEVGTGLTDIYRVRGGDLVRITDFSPTDGAITLRIAEVTQTDAGIVMGIEAPSFAGGSLTPTAGGVTRGTFIQIDPDAYAPSGAPGSTTPTSGGGSSDTIPDLGGGPVKSSPTGGITWKLK